METTDNNIMPAFIADCHLGKLAKYLRFMGFDTLYFAQIDDNDLIDLANDERRVILTRDRELYERKKAECILLKTVAMEEQLKEVITIFHLQKFHPQRSRCIVCNEPLQAVKKEDIIDKIPSKVGTYFSYFEMCKRCERIYWHGDHYKRMKASLDEILGSV
jgi:uncharacterized protein with PIN domain